MVFSNLGSEQCAMLDPTKNGIVQLNFTSDTPIISVLFCALLAALHSESYLISEQLRVSDLFLNRHCRMTRHVVLKIETIPYAAELIWKSGQSLLNVCNGKGHCKSFFTFWPVKNLACSVRVCGLFRPTRRCFPLENSTGHTETVFEEEDEIYILMLL